MNYGIIPLTSQILYNFCTNIYNEIFETNRGQFSFYLAS